MATEADDFRTLMRGMQAGDKDATDRFCREYERPILRVVRRTLLPQYRTRYDSLDFVNDVWASFFANPPADARFDDPQSLIAYLARMARNKIGEVRRHAGTAKNDLEREEPLEVAGQGARDGGLPAPGGTPSQIVGAEDEFQRMLRDRSPVQKGILMLLRQGLNYREIADRLNTTEKTIWRLIRRLDPETRSHARPAHRS